MSDFAWTRHAPKLLLLTKCTDLAVKRSWCLQVNSKSAQLVELLNGLSGGLRAYALLRLAQGFLDLSEGVSVQPFPLHDPSSHLCVTLRLPITLLSSEAESRNSEFRTLVSRFSRVIISLFHYFSNLRID